MPSLPRAQNRVIVFLFLPCSTLRQLIFFVLNNTNSKPPIPVSHGPRQIVSVFVRILFVNRRDRSQSPPPKGFPSVAGSKITTQPPPSLIRVTPNCAVEAFD